MLKTVALGIALGLLAGSAVAQTVHTPLPPVGGGAILVDHDRGEQRGRKLGHMKQRQADDEDDEGNAQRSRSRQRWRGQGSTNPGWDNPAPAPYYGSGGGYYPSPYYDYGRPPYYRGY